MRHGFFDWCESGHRDAQRPADGSLERSTRNCKVTGQSGEARPRPNSA